jgi:hypothetical protein
VSIEDHIGQNPANASQNATMSPYYGYGTGMPASSGSMAGALGATAPGTGGVPSSTNGTFTTSAPSQIPVSNIGIPALDSKVAICMIIGVISAVLLI